jgi:hypothetical protein
VSLPDDAVNPLRLYDDWREASFIARPNRFTLVLKIGGRELRAFIPNTGRLEEYLVEGGVYYLTTSLTEKFTYRTVSIYYQDSHVLLDTWKINDLAEARGSSCRTSTPTESSPSGSSRPGILRGIPASAPTVSP